MKDKLIISLLVFLSLGLFYSSYKDYQSARVQYLVINEMNNGDKTLKRQNYELLKKLDKSYPNITVTTLPLYSVEALYDLSFGNIESALINTVKARKINPYLMFNESILADVYKKMGLKDSAHFYAKKAYKNLPGSGKHFLQYANTLIEQNKFAELIPEYFNSNFKDRINFKKVFLGAVVGKDIASRRIDSMATKEIYSTNEELRVLALFRLNGQKNGIESYKLSKRAENLMEQNDIEKAIETFKSAIAKSPYDYKSIEDLGFLYLLKGDYNNAIDNFEIIIQNSNTIKSQSYYGLAYSFYQLGEISKACDYLDLSINLNNQKAVNLSNQICSA